MSEATIRADLYATLSGVTNIGKVYDYDRYPANEWGAFLDLFKTTISSVDQIRGWMIGYEGYEAVQLANTVVIREHNFVARGFLRLDDSAASEKTMSALAETVCNAFFAHFHCYFGVMT